MIQNLQASDIHNMMVEDFVDGWNALAKDKTAKGRGNFKFGLQATILLEFVGRLCKGSPPHFNSFLTELEKIDRRYFTKIPGLSASFRYFDVPLSRRDELLWVIFNLIRNGEAHQYQAQVATLSDGKSLAIILTGARSRRYLKLDSPKRFARHLGIRTDPGGDVWIAVYPNTLFRDLEEALKRSGVLTPSLAFSYNSFQYPFSSSTLLHSLLSGGHKKVRRL
jgi:hypothetical protein